MGWFFTTCKNFADSGTRINGGVPPKQSEGGPSCHEVSDGDWETASEENSSEYKKVIFLRLNVLVRTATWPMMPISWFRGNETAFIFDSQSEAKQSGRSVMTLAMPTNEEGVAKVSV